MVKVGLKRLKCF